MSALAIRVEDVSKRYRVGELNAHRTLRETLMEGMKRPARRIRERLRGEGGASSEDTTFWALKNVSFEVNQGDVLGIIGRNGAGKSTVLKVLSRITEPTSGRVEGYGRVGSLLEVGTGFHPELSGRENIYLNGAILGMSRPEINRKFDEIVDFSEIERFIDTPVKRYSSGMYVRLAFAVAAHLEPEILLVDEVLAVGDMQFQKKCLGKMSTVAREGRTVLFISHNMAAIRSLCTRGIVLEHGQVTCDGTVQECVTRYSSQRQGELSHRWSRPSDRPVGALSIDAVDVSLSGEQPVLRLDMRVDLATHQPHRPSYLAVDIRDLGGIPVMQAMPRIDGYIPDNGARHSVDLSIQLPGLVPGDYMASIWAGPHNEETLDQVDDVVSFEVTESPTPGRTYPHTTDHGFVVPPSSVVYRQR